MFVHELAGNCSSIIDTSIIHGGRMFAGAWARVVPNNPVAFPQSMEVTHMSSVIRFGTFLLFFCFVIPSFVSAESVREFHQRKCEQGNAESCGRAADLLEGERHAQRIVELGDLFAAELDRSVMEEGNKPFLKEAYTEVLDDYFVAEADNGIKPLINKDLIKLCAEHYNDYWRNRKLWWPTNVDGQPDWSTIYYYIVEHYYGYCLRSAY